LEVLVLHKLDKILHANKMRGVVPTAVLILSNGTLSLEQVEDICSAFFWGWLLQHKLGQIEAVMA
jgi:hypothetical protein